MTNFYFGVLLGKDVKKVTDTNDAEAKRKRARKNTGQFNSPAMMCTGTTITYSNTE